MTRDSPQSLSWYPILQALYWLDHLQPADRPQVGEKALALGQLQQQGYSVVPGFVISAAVLQDFLETLQWAEPLFADLPHSSLHLDVDNFQQLQAIAQRIRQSILQAHLPKDLLGTISATCQALGVTTMLLRPSLALPIDVNTRGLLEARICDTQPETMGPALRQLWADLFQAKNLLYWHQCRIQVQQLRLAVLVQPLQNAIASGTLTTRRDTWDIQAIWGLGTALVRGEVVPDRYRVEVASGQVHQELGRRTYAYCDTTTAPNFPREGEAVEVSTRVRGLNLYLLSERASFALAPAQLQELLHLTHRLQATLKAPFDLEWLVCQPNSKDGPQIYLTQIDVHFSPDQSVPAPPVPEIGAAPSQGGVGLAAAPGRAIAPAFVLQDQTWQNVPPNVILVASSITPDWLPLLQQVAGIVTEQGGVTSHAAIIARELGIPAVVGVPQATQMFQSGESLLLNGDQGLVQRVGLQEQLYNAISTDTTGTRVPLATQLMVNLSQVESLERVTQLPVDGVGLLRSELLLIQCLERQHPQRWIEQGRQRELTERLAQRIRQFCLAFTPRPVFYRSVDWRSHEFQTLEGNPDAPEPNPMLGLRGTFRYQLYPDLFQIELAALVQVHQSGCHNFNLLLPFVRTVEEFRFCRQQMQQAGLGNYANLQTWIMAEVPSVLLLLPEYVRAGVQGISIGTNDLTQLLLGVDRDQAALANAFDERHPAVQQAIAHLIHSARRLGIPCTLCGQAPVLYPELIAPLVQWGITGISVDPGAVERTYQAIARAERELLLSAVRGQPPQEGTL